MKRLLAFVTVFSVIAFSLCLIAFAAEDAVDISYDTDYSEAKEFMDYISGTELFKDGAVSRAAFVEAMLGITKTQIQQKSDDYFFSDVKSFSEYAPAVYTAVDMGWISRSDVFAPERAIAPFEALKILLSAMNYDFIAQNKGGYPSGYLYVANVLDITDGVNMNESAMNSADVYKLVFNAMCASTPEQITFGDTEEFKKTGDSLLKQIYGIYIIEGIVSRTPYNTLSGSESIEKGDITEIDGVAYKSAYDVPWDIIGCYSRVFVRESISGLKDEIVYIRDLSEKTAVTLADFESREGNIISVWKENGAKLRRIKLSSDCQYIYNGRKISSNIDYYIKKGAGNLLFADNDDDGAYDVVYINSYSYITVLSYDSVTETVRDKTDADFTVCIDEIPTIIKNDSGMIIEPIDINSGDTLRVERSLDGGFIKLTRIGTALTGVVNEINEAEGTITVDDTQYIMSEYFLASSRHQVNNIPVEISLVYDGNTIVAATATGVDMKYGYLTAHKWVNGMENKLKVRIFNQSGMFGEYGVRDKIIIDGVRGQNTDDLIQAISRDGETVHQLVRFGTDGNGELRAIDFVTDVLPDVPGVYGDPMNKLTRYTYTSNVRYRSNISSMSTLYNIGNAIVFNIPNDINDDENFLAGNKSLFVNDVSYSSKLIEVYNLDSYGGAEAIVYRNDNPNQNNPDSVPMLIRSINNSLDAQGNEIYTVNGWCNGSFVTLYLEHSVDVAKKSVSASAKPVKSTHPLLSGGDIIKYSADGSGNIKSVEVIFDARKNVFAMNDSKVNQLDYSSPQYYVGKVYDVGNNFAVISVAGDDFSQANLRYVSLSTNSLVQYNARNGDTRPISVSEIKTYKANGTDAHYAVFCMNNLYTKTAMFYEETEAR